MSANDTYPPITGELRAAMREEGDRLTVDAARFDRLCDGIDAVHAGLERENATLREVRHAGDER